MSCLRCDGCIRTDNSPKDTCFKGDVRQVDTNKVLVKFNNCVSERYVTNPCNYWLRGNECRPSGIATVGVNGCLNANNTLTPARVTICRNPRCENEYLFTFSSEITPQTGYTLLIRNETTPNPNCGCNKVNYSIIVSFTGTNCFKPRLDFKEIYLKNTRA